MEFLDIATAFYHSKINHISSSETIEKFVLINLHLCVYWQIIISTNVINRPSCIYINPLYYIQYGKNWTDILLKGIIEDLYDEYCKRFKDKTSYIVINPIPYENAYEEDIEYIECIKTIEQSVYTFLPHQRRIKTVEIIPSIDNLRINIVLKNNEVLNLRASEINLFMIGLVRMVAPAHGIPKKYVYNETNIYKSRRIYNKMANELGVNAILKKYNVYNLILYKNTYHTTGFLCPIFITCIGKNKYDYIYVQDMDCMGPIRKKRRDIIDYISMNIKSFMRGADESIKDINKISLMDSYRKILKKVMRKLSFVGTTCSKPIEIITDYRYLDYREPRIRNRYENIYSIIVRRYSHVNKNISIRSSYSFDPFARMIENFSWQYVHRNYDRILNINDYININYNQINDVIQYLHNRQLISHSLITK